MRYAKSLRLNVFTYVNDDFQYNTINSTENKYLGRVNVNLTIGNNTHKVELIIINNENTNYNLVLGLDLITKFNLSLRDNYRIIQTYNTYDQKDISEEILTNYSNFGIKGESTTNNNKYENELKANLCFKKNTSDNEVSYYENSNLSKENEIRLNDMLSKYSNIFSKQI